MSTKKTICKELITVDPSVDLIASVITAAFRQHGWTWSLQLPTHNKIANTIAMLAEMAYESGVYGSCESGRIKVQLNGTENGKVVADVYLSIGTFLVDEITEDDGEQ